MNSISEQKDLKATFSKGDEVIHVKYGVGKIRDIVRVDLGVLDQKKFRDVTGLDTEDYLIIVKFKGSSRLRKFSLYLCNMRGCIQKVTSIESKKVLNEKNEIISQTMEEITAEQPIQVEIITDDLSEQRASDAEANTNLNSKSERKPDYKAGIHTKNKIIEGGANVCQRIA